MGNKARKRSERDPLGSTEGNRSGKPYYEYSLAKVSRAGAADPRQKGHKMTITIYLIIAGVVYATAEITQRYVKRKHPEVWEEWENAGE